MVINDAMARQLNYVGGAIERTALRRRG